MSFKLTKNIKVAVICTDGELVIEFRRPTNREKNQFFARQLDIKTEGEARLNDLDEIRVSMYDQFVQSIYVERDGKREDVIDDEDRPIGPKDLPEDTKVKAAMRAFESGAVVAKNF